MLPSPTAEPAAAIITPILLPKEPLVEKSNPLIFNPDLRAIFFLKA
jgi:hypothetical protein